MLLHAGLLVALVGAASILRPLRRLGIRRRRSAACLFALGAALAGAVAIFPSDLVRLTSTSERTASVLDDLMSAYHFNELHHIHVQATPERVWSAIREVRPGEIRLFLVLTGIRSLNPGRVFGRNVPSLESQPPILDVAQRGGFVILEERPGREIVLGTCGQFWRLRGSGRCPDVRNADEMLAFGRPGYAKATLNFRVVPEGGGSRVTTETRILATDDGARRRFAAYWRTIYPGSALIRRGWLAAIKRRAERGG